MWSAICIAVVTVSYPAKQEMPTLYRFQWSPGQEFDYTVKQTTSIHETVPGQMAGKLENATTTTRLELNRRWTVASVDAAGVAQLKMTVLAMKQVIERPGPLDRDGKPTVDQVVIDSSTAEGKEQLAAFLGKPIVSITIDPRGKLLSAKSEGGASDRLQAELPFRIAFPEKMPGVSDSWKRPFEIVLNPPYGTGEKYQAEQTYRCKESKDSKATFLVSTQLVNPPKEETDMPGLIPLLWIGEVDFDNIKGQYLGARLTVDKELSDHQGQGSRFRYKSELVETLTSRK